MSSAGGLAGAAVAVPAGWPAHRAPAWRPRRYPGVVEQRRDGRLVLAAPGATEAVGLNPTAEAIWRLCDGSRSVPEILARLAAAFRAAPEALRRDVEATLVRLVADRLMGPASGGLPRGGLPSGGRHRIDLRRIPCFVINLEAAVERRRRIEAQLGALGMRHERVVAVEGDPVPFAVSLSHRKVLRHPSARPPFLVLEDDCEFVEGFRPVLDVPVEADVLHLGSSLFGLEEPGRAGPGTCWATRWDVFDTDYLRVSNMLSTHAMLYLSTDFHRRSERALADALGAEPAPHHFDVHSALLHPTHVVLTPDRPLCHQWGVNEVATSQSLPDVIPGGLGPRDDVPAFAARG